jgi:predicted nucleic acid-binding protein
MTTPLVVDASVALKWYVVEQESERAERLLHGSFRLHAPSLLKLELANALSENVRRQIITEAQALFAFSGADRTIGQWHATDDVVPLALEWSLALRHPVYDLCYLALAQSVGARVVTADTAFLRKIEGRPQARFAVALMELS